MQSNEIIPALLTHADTTAWHVSHAIGASRSYVDTLLRRKGTPRIDTCARIADACGCDLVLIDRRSGERVAVIDPPAKG